jgi:hypothetical protein
MVWSQGLATNEVIDPTMAYQEKQVPDNITVKNSADEWNGCLMEDSFVLHRHASYRASRKTQMMQSTLKMLKIPEIPVNPRSTKTVDISQLP